VFYPLLYQDAVWTQLNTCDAWASMTATHVIGPCFFSGPLNATS